MAYGALMQCDRCFPRRLVDHFSDLEAWAVRENSANIFRLTAVPLVLLLSACGLSGKAVTGQVLEEGTSKPIADAIVVIRWTGTVSAIVDSKGVCVHVDATTTDANGRYQFAAWRKPSSIGPVSDVGAVVSAYKAGYEQQHYGIDSTVRLTLATAENMPRLDYLSRFAGGVHCDVESDVKLLPLYKAIYNEASSNAETMEERRKVLYHLKDIEVIELGSERAWENFHRREQELK